MFVGSVRLGVWGAVLVVCVAVLVSGVLFSVGVWVGDLLIFLEVFERSRSKSSPLEQTRSKLTNPVELTGFDRG